MSTVTIHVKGLEELVNKANPAMLEQPLRRFFDRAGIAVLTETQRRAPVDTGRLRSSLMRGGKDGIWSLQGGKRPKRLIVGTNVTHRGISYPSDLEESDRYHYRGGRARGRAHPKAIGPFARQRTGLLGQPTKGWFSGGAKIAAQRFGHFVKLMAKEIERGWDS